MRNPSVYLVKILPFIIIFPFVYLFDLTFSYSFKLGETTNSAEPFFYSEPKLTNLNSSHETYSSLDASIHRFIQKWDLAGTSIAIARHGRLVYAKGFGYADRESGEIMQPYHLLRIASVSKLITAVTIMKLVDQGQLNLNQKVFGVKGILNEPIYLDYLDERVEQITVIQLLNHSAGWTTHWGDHLFMHESISRQSGKELPLTKDDIICFALSKRLHFNPGSRSSYNNIGYTILERVIERTSGRSYESFVQDEVFKPLGIFDAFIAHNFDSLRYPKEVRYYEVPEAELVPAFDGQKRLFLKSRGGNDVRNLGAAGGWVISSVSLIKFILDIDADNPNGIVLSHKAARRLEQVDPGFSPLGWKRISPNGDKWRTGSFAGTSALAISRNDDFTYVFLTNSSPWVGAKFPYEVNRFMASAMQRVDHWPDYDLFNPSTIYKNINLPFIADFQSFKKNNNQPLTIRDALFTENNSLSREVYKF